MNINLRSGMNKARCRFLTLVVRESSAGQAECILLTPRPMLDLMNHEASEENLPLLLYNPNELLNIDVHICTAKKKKKVYDTESSRCQEHNIGNIHITNHEKKR